MRHIKAKSFSLMFYRDQLFQRAYKRKLIGADRWNSQWVLCQPFGELV